eukprot:1153588-Pelagomonas_calceolata.AAC.5
MMCTQCSCAMPVRREPPEEGVMCEALWSDPSPVKGRTPSKRGVGVMFDAQILMASSCQVTGISKDSHCAPPPVFQSGMLQHVLGREGTGVCCNGREGTGVCCNMLRTP